MPSLNPKRLLQPLRQFAATLFTERLDPRHAAAAIFLGIFIGVAPIYGFQTVAVIALAALFRLNKPLAIGATFVNNPILQPLLIVGGLEFGYFLKSGKFLRISRPHSVADLKSQLGTFVIGSIALGIVLGALGAALTFVILKWRQSDQSPRAKRARFVNALFSGVSNFDRGFVRWKMRLDRIFDFLAAEELGSGPVVDLGCGYGISLGFAAFHNPERRLLGCDLDAHRITAAREALAGMNTELAVCDVRQFEFPQANLIFIFDVLQYLTGPEQLALLQRCASALAPGGKLIFRIPDRGSKTTSRLSVAFDRLIFFLGKNSAGPVVLSADEYQGAFGGAGLQINHRRLRNRLPIAHRVFVVEKPEAA